MVFLSGILTSNRVETVDSLGVRGEAAALVSNLAFLFGQIILIPRLFRKRYRSFRVEVLRHGDATNPKLSAQEKMRVGIGLAWPQAAYMVLTAFVVSWAGAVVDGPAATRGIGSMLFWLRFLLVGPYAIHFVIPRDYPCFRLEAYGQRYV